MTKEKLCVYLRMASEISLYILIFALPFSKSIVEITIVSALASFVLERVLAKKRLLTDITHVDIFLFIFLLAALPSFANTDYFQTSFRALFTKVIKFAVLFLLVKEIIDTKDKVRNVVITAASSCAMILVDGFIQHFITHRDLLHNYPSFLYLDTNPSVLGNPTASFPYPNDYAAWILVFIFPAAAFMLSKRSGWMPKIISALLFLGLLYTLFLTRVRGAWISFAAAFSLASVVKLKYIGIILLIIFLLSAVVIDKSFVSYILSFSSARDRGVMWNNSMKIFGEHPIIGNGINTFYLNYARVRDDEYKNQKGSYAHNCYLQMATETGIIGLMAFLLFIGALVLKGVRSVNRLKDNTAGLLASGLIFGIIAFLLHSAVDTNLYSLNLAALFWFSSGLMMAAIKIGTSDEK